MPKDFDWQVHLLIIPIEHVLKAHVDILDLYLEIPQFLCNICFSPLSNDKVKIIYIWQCY